LGNGSIQLATEDIVNVSIIVPVYNEVDTLNQLHETLSQALDRLKGSWEVVFVDDGSTDRSLEVLKAIAARDKNHTRIIALRRNFGQTTAIAAGIDHTKGDIIVLIDADMQNDPADIPMMIKKITEEDYDLVSGWRQTRKDKFVSRRIPSWIANWVISRVTGVVLHDYGCTLKAYRREVITGFRLYGEMHRFIPAYAVWIGAKITEVPVNHYPRQYGKTKYGLERTIKVILDLFTVKFLISFSQKPIYLFGGAGLGLVFISFLSVFYLLYRRFLFDEHLIHSPLLQMSVMLFVLGFLSVLLGLIAELLVRTYHEAQGKVTYTIKSKFNLE
jgi:glycosyltransferase involved in cell wall biosynthesis